MKKIILTIALLLSFALPSKAQFGADAAAVISFLAPYMGALQFLSEATGVEISDLKSLTQESIRITSDLARIYNSGHRLYRISDNTVLIYKEYLTTVQYIYDNSMYIDQATAKYHVAVLNKSVFGDVDANNKLSINNVLGGTMSELSSLLTNMEGGAHASLTEMATYLDGVNTKIDNTLGSVRSYKSYMQCIVRHKQHDLGMYEIDKYLITKKQK